MTDFIILNWREVHILAQQLQKELVNRKIERIFIPQRNFTDLGFRKYEFAIEFNRSSRNPFALIVNLMPHQCGVYVSRKKLHVSQNATQSSFVLSISKYLKSSLVESIQAVPSDRILEIKLSSHSEKKTFFLFIAIFPAKPRSILFSAHQPQSSDAFSYKNQFLNVETQSHEDCLDFFQATLNSNVQPCDVAVREELFAQPDALSMAYEKSFQVYANQDHLQKTLRSLKSEKKKLQRRTQSLNTHLVHANNEPNWKKLGILLGTVVSDLKNIEKEKSLRQTLKTETFHWYGLESDTKKKSTAPLLEIFSFKEDQWIAIPYDAKYSFSEFLDHCFNSEKRKQRKILETKKQIEELQEQVSEIQKKIESNETLLSHQSTDKPFSPLTSPSQLKKIPSKKTVGREYVSSSGLVISIGRNQKENLAVTFRKARGNDVWLHVRGRPSAHAVIHVPPKKTVPLDTLLEAAQLIFHFSGGMDWGSTEVDYTFRKHVKKIPKSTEVSYSQNKTLTLSPDRKVIKSLQENQTEDI